MTCNEKWIVKTTCCSQLSGWIEKKLQSTSQTKLAPKERSWSLCSGLLPFWSATVFWIPVKPLHLRSMLSKSMRGTENCNSCSWHWSAEGTQVSSRTTPDCMSHHHHFKSWMIWAIKFCLIHHIHLTSHQLTATFSSISTTFCKENASTTKNAFQEFVKSQSKDFYIAEVNKQFSLTRMYWL